VLQHAEFVNGVDLAPPLSKVEVAPSRCGACAQQPLQPPGRCAIKEDLSSSAAACITALSPSGVVPGDGDGVRSDELVFFSGEEFDCFLLSFVWVLFINVEGLFVFPLFSKVLYVNCNPTD
jgi:hypothetical protein